MYKLKNKDASLAYPFPLSNDSEQYLFELAIRSAPFLLQNGTIIKVDHAEEETEKTKKEQKHDASRPKRKRNTKKTEENTEKASVNIKQKNKDAKE